MSEKLKVYLVKAGGMYVSSCKADAYTKQYLYAKLNPKIAFARVFETWDEAMEVAIDIDGTVIPMEQVVNEYTTYSTDPRGVR